MDKPTRILSLTAVQSWIWDFGNDPKFARSRWLLNSNFMRFLYLKGNFSAKKMVKMAWGKRSPLTPALHRKFCEPFPNPSSRIGTWAFAQLVGSAEDFHEQVWDRRSHLSNIPLAVIWGAADKVVGPMQRDKWYEVQSNLRMINIADAGHWPQEEAPELVTKAIQDLIESLGQVKR
jgi:haloalkane dehalogenase